MPHQDFDCRVVKRENVTILGGGDYFGITGGEIRRKCTPHDTRLHYTTLRGVKFFERGRYLAKNNYRVTTYKLGSKGTSYKGEVKLHKIYTYLSPRQRQRHTHAHTHAHTRERRGRHFALPGSHFCKKLHVKLFSCP